MSDFYYQGHQAEVDIVFPAYSIKVNLNQSCIDFRPITALYFQRFVNFIEYSSLQHFNLQERLCAQIILPEPQSQTDLQKTFCLNLAPRTMMNEVIVAETIDETAEFIYLIIDFNRHSMINALFNSHMLSVFKFSFGELWTMPTNELNFVRNLQLTNLWMSKQIQEFCSYLECFRQNASYWHMMAVVKETQVEKLTKESKETQNVKKVLKKPIIKSEAPSFDCLLCCDSAKNIVFLPCGHIVACKTCTTDSLDIELGKVLNQRRSPRTCPVCKQTVKEAREVFL